MNTLKTLSLHAPPKKTGKWHTEYGMCHRLSLSGNLQAQQEPQNFFRASRTHKRQRLGNIFLTSRYPTKYCYDHSNRKHHTAQTTAISIDDVIDPADHGAAPLVGTRLPVVMLFAVRHTSLESAHRGDWSPLNDFLKTVIKTGEAWRTQES